MPNIIEIKDINDPALDDYARLTGAQLRNRLEPERGIFIAESPTVIGIALRAGCVPKSILAERKHIESQAMQFLERFPALPVYTADREVLEQLAGFALTRGILSAMYRPKPKRAEEVCMGAKRIAVLEGIVDATNIGAIFRSAAALGIDAVLTTPTCCDPLCRRALRVSMGTIFQVPFAGICENDADWRENGARRLHEMGFATAAMALSDDSVPIDDENLAKEERLAIILGTEGDGLAPRTIAACDYCVRIPMAHGVDSLNVAAASAVAFWQLRK